MRLIELNPNIHEPFEIGAALMAAVAFPAVGEVESRLNATRALCCQILDATVEAEPHFEAQKLFPQYAGLSPRAKKSALRTTARRYRDRMVAARIADAFFSEASTGMPVPLVGSMKRRSLNQLCELVQPESGISDPENVEKFVWRASRPVIHLASAFRSYGNMKFSGSNELPYDLHNLEAHRAIVLQACFNEQLVALDKRFGIKPDRLLKVRWVE